MTPLPSKYGIAGLLSVTGQSPEGCDIGMGLIFAEEHARRRRTEAERDGLEIRRARMYRTLLEAKHAGEIPAELLTRLHAIGWTIGNYTRTLKENT